LLYSFTGFLCGVVLLGVVWQSETLAFVLAISGCLAFLFILYSRRDELTLLQSDLRARMTRGRQERQAAQYTWEAIQKIELLNDVDAILKLVEDTTQKLGCDAMRANCYRGGKLVAGLDTRGEVAGGEASEMSGPTATFRLNSGHDLVLSVSLHQTPDSEIAADIAFRFLQRLSLATAERISRVLDETELKSDSEEPEEPPDEPRTPVDDATRRTSGHLMVPVAVLSAEPLGRSLSSWWRWAVNWPFVLLGLSNPGDK
jgi:UDP-GlcNAc:undecaprenyl-phosphate GlcNAc-1-phosphate transferase